MLENHLGISDGTTSLWRMIQNTERHLLPAEESPATYTYPIPPGSVLLAPFEVVEDQFCILLRHGKLVVTHLWVHDQRPPLLDQFPTFALT